MKMNEVFNGLAAISAVSNAYQELKNDVTDHMEFEQAATTLLEHICASNTSLCSADCLSNGADDGVTFGRIRMPLEGTESMRKTVESHIPQMVADHEIQLEAKLDFSKSFSMIMNVDKDVDQAAALSQQMIIAMIKRDKNLFFRCADLVMGGNFFSSVHKLVTLFPTKTGGKVYTKTTELSELIDTLDKAAVAAMTRLGGAYASVEEYNSSNSVTIARHITTIHLNATAYSNEEYDRLRVLMENGKRNGMSFVLVGTDETTAPFAACADYQLHFGADSLKIGSTAKVPFVLQQFVALTEEEIESTISLLKAAETVDTRYERHRDLHTDFFTMDSAEALRIPFAIDSNNMPVHFEIGGEAPSHALIAGATGSGKSVALHTLIMQIVHNYHPDDVEIWAIDYKAVEFARYFDHRTPHFRVIAHDTSNEFSLSLIDLLYEEYEKRQKAFLQAKVKNINEYRGVYGKHAMPRIIAIIDEFQLMTQAVQEYTGEVDYRTRLENLLRLTRAMGISFVLCSQTIASGLSGLSDAARDQIGCRLCLKHDDDNEIRETLVLSGADASDIAARAKELRRGQGIYKRARWAHEHSPDGKAYEFLHAYILYISDNQNVEMIKTANALLENRYTPKEEILVRGGGRIAVEEKIRHPLTQFLKGSYEADDECVQWYPAAPTTLADSYCLEIENTASVNMVLVGEDDNLRESIVVHSVCGFLMNPNTKVEICFLDEHNADRARLLGHLQKIRSPQLHMNIGIRDCMKVIGGLRKFRPTGGANTVYIWYGLEKLKNEIFLLNQDEEEEDAQPVAAPASREDLLADLDAFLSEITRGNKDNVKQVTAPAEDLTFDECKEILRQAFELGPENNKFHMVIINNWKAMKKTGLIDLEYFENRIGTKMSTDASYELFGSSLAVGKTDENTVIYYAGSGSVVPLRPYLLPEDGWLAEYNRAIKML